MREGGREGGKEGERRGNREGEIYKIYNNREKHSETMSTAV